MGDACRKRHSTNNIHLFVGRILTGTSVLRKMSLMNMHGVVGRAEVPSRLEMGEFQTQSRRNSEFDVLLVIRYTFSPIFARALPT